jgi:hypothetical protein
VNEVKVSLGCGEDGRNNRQEVKVLLRIKPKNLQKIENWLWLG